MSKWIVALLVGLLSIKCVLSADMGSVMDDFQDDMGLETGSFESEMISQESEDISRRDINSEDANGEGSIIGNFVIPEEPKVPSTQSSSATVPVNVAVRTSQTEKLPTEAVPLSARTPRQPTTASAPSNLLFEMDVSNVLNGGKKQSLQEKVESAAQGDESQGSNDEDEGGDGSDEERFEMIRYSRPAANLSEDSQSDSSDSAEWYALIHSRRPKSNNQPPPVSNIPSSRGPRDYNRNRDDRQRDDRRDRRRDDRETRERRDNNQDDRRVERGENRERLARYDPAEAQGGPYFVPVSERKQREHRMRMRGDRDRGSYSEDVTSASSSSSQESYTSTGYDDKGRHYTRHHHSHKKSRRPEKRGKRKVGYFEGLAREIPKKVTKA